jgi:6-phosphogluconolactonase/glucosamine-6-phosphate isomerase/deaminase
LNFIYEPDAKNGAAKLSERLVSELQSGKKVLWLVCGGSSIPLEASAMKQVPRELQKNLTIALTDERYGEFNHPDSNWLQLDEAGFQAGEATIIPTLAPNLSLDETCKTYEQNITQALDKADIVIAQFGIGADGHIAGALPGSPAITDDKMVVGYDAGNFTRITLTPTALRRITVAFAFVYGDSKLEALQNLRDRELSLDEQPAQILKQLSEAYVYNDQIGEAQ